MHEHEQEQIEAKQKNYLELCDRHEDSDDNSEDG